jgi:glycosyltransferase involved in cell wall biosynthesis
MLGFVLLAYRKIPLTREQRMRIKHLMFGHFGFLFRGLPAYEMWLTFQAASGAVNRKHAPSFAYQKQISKMLWIINHWDLQTQKYRVFNYVDELSRHGCQSEVLYDDSLEQCDVTRFDLIILSRIAASHSSRVLVVRAKSCGIPVIYDIDDLVFCPERVDLIRFTSALSQEEQATFENGVALRREMMLMCDAVTTSTFSLSREVRRLGCSAFVLPNTISRSDFAQSDELIKRLRKSARTRIRIGYFSGTKTHQRDFAECDKGLLRIVSEFPNVEFVVVGHLDIPEHFKSYGDRVFQKPLMPHREMLAVLATVDINLVPLEPNNAFTECKSELKIFEAALYGIPSIATPTATFASIVEHGVTGMLARTENDWYSSLRYLITNTETRNRIGLRARQTIVPRFSIETTVEEAKTIYGSIINSRTPSLTTCAPIDSVRRSATPLVTVVAVLYRKRNEVRYFLESLRRQEFPGVFEVLLVDDRSPDDSVAVAEEFVRQMSFAQFASAEMRVRILRNPTNMGNCASRNRAIKEAAGEVLMVVDADCMLNRSFLSEHYNAYLHGDCDAAIGPLNIETLGAAPYSVLGCHEADVRLRIDQGQVQDPINPDSFVNCVTRNFSVRKQFLVDQLSGYLFDEQFGYSENPESGFGWEDVEMGCRLYKSAARIRYLPQTFSIHVSHPSATDEATKPLRSLKNFRRLHEKYPDLVLLSRQWAIRTYQAILESISASGRLVSDNPDYAYLQDLFGRQDHAPVSYKRHHRLRVLTYRWHCPHQFELYRTGYEFTLVTGAGTALCDSWDWEKRPLPPNARFLNRQYVNSRDFDVAILHFDENLLHPEKCKGMVPADWGNTMRWFMETVALPKIAICHGTPQFAGQYDAEYVQPDLGVVDESSRVELVKFLGDTLVVCNSYQAQREWGFKNSTVIWQGFSPHEYPETIKDQEILTMPYAALRNRPHYNGLFIYKKVSELLNGSMQIDSLEVPDPPKSYGLRSHDWAEAKFRNYAREIGRYRIYLNPTLRSPMPRTRGEAMMAGAITVSMRNHDVDQFIQNGVNGFFADSPEELAEQLRFLKQQPAAMRKVSAASRLTALDQFNQDRYLSDWGRVLKGVVG